MKSSEDNTPISGIKLEKKSFEKLKTEIDNLFSELSSNQCYFQNDDMIMNLYRIKELIKFCIADTEDIESIYTHIEELKKEKDGFKLQAKRLYEENIWLREELTLTQDKLQKKELEYIEVEEKNKSLNFSLEMQNNQNFENNLAKNSKILDENKSQIPSNMGTSISNSTMSFNNITSVMENTTGNGNVLRGNLGTPYNLPNHEVPPRLKTLHQLVIQYATQGRYEIAIPLCKQTLQDLEQSSGHYHPDVATMLNILALVYRNKGDFQEAVESLTEALEIRKKTLGPDSPKVAATLNNLSVLYAKQGNHAEAEPLCRDALKIRESILGTHHPDVAKQLNNLALLCHNQGKYDEVEKYYRRALNIYLSSFPSTDSNVVKTKNSLASSYIKQGKYHDAELLLKNILNEAMDKQWSGRERDAESKPIWVIAEERERMRNRSMSMEILPSAIITEKCNININGVNDTNTNNDDNFPNNPPYGFEIKHRNTDDKLALLNALKLLASLYSRENKDIAANIIEDWLIWAGRALSKYEKDIKWISYESSLVQSDIFSSQIDKSQTFWYRTPSPGKRSSANISGSKPLNKTSFLLLDSSSTLNLNVDSTSNLLRLSEYSGQSNLSAKPKLPSHLSPYLYKTPLPVADLKDSAELSEDKFNEYPMKYGVQPSFRRNSNLRKATSTTTLTDVKNKI